MYEIEHLSKGKIFQTTIMCGQITKHSLIRDFFLTLTDHSIEEIEKLQIEFRIVTSKKRKIIKHFTTSQLLKLSNLDNIFFAKGSTNTECNRHFNLIL